MAVVNVQEAKANLSKLRNLVEAGEEVIIARHGKPVARLERLAPAAVDRKPGTWRDVIAIDADFDDEFDPAWLEPIEP